MICDACALINLANGGLLEVDYLRAGIELFVGDACLGEATAKRDEDAFIETAVKDGVIGHASPVALSDIEKMSSSQKIGVGEAECICAAKVSDFVVHTDDKRARKVAETLVGENKVIGTPSVLRMLVMSGVLDPTTALDAYRKMIDAGAFLPPLPSDYFEV